MLKLLMKILLVTRSTLNWPRTTISWETLKLLQVIHYPHVFLKKEIPALVIRGAIRVLVTTIRTITETMQMRISNEEKTIVKTMKREIAIPGACQRTIAIAWIKTQETIRIDTKEGVKDIHQEAK